MSSKKVEIAAANESFSMEYDEITDQGVARSVSNIKKMEIDITSTEDTVTLTIKRHDGVKGFTAIGLLRCLEFASNRLFLAIANAEGSSEESRETNNKH